MNKKLFAIFMVVILAIVSIGGVYALDLGGLLSGDPQDLSDSLDPDYEKVTIDGFDFKIPKDFEELINNNTKQYNQTVDGIPYFSTIKNYGDGNDTISISVCENEDHEATDDTASGVGGDSETINGVDGYLDFHPKSVSKFRSGNTLYTITFPSYYTFSYAKDGKLVVITTTDKDYISDVIIE